MIGQIARIGRSDRTSQSGRRDWVDAAKGLCIILVVLFHSTLGVEKELGSLTWMHTVIEWAKPFRMPDFFLISGLFLAARIGRPWREFLDAKVVHFAYFYLVWFHIHFGLRFKALVNEVRLDAAVRQYFEGYIDPFGSLWFIYLLAVFCIVTKLVRGQPVWLVGGLGLAAHVLIPLTGNFLFDEFVSRFVFFYTGYALAPVILNYASQVSRVPKMVLAGGLCLWAIVNTLGLTTGLAEFPVFELGFAALGIAAVIAFSVAVTRPAHGNAAGAPGTWLGSALTYCGRNSIVIYLAFTIFMALTRTILLKASGMLAISLDGGLVAISSATAGLFGALILHMIVRDTKLGFLFVRPDAFRLNASALSPRASHRMAQILRRS